jgi:uncharacterized protein YndB with AHSA1/START domain
MTKYAKLNKISAEAVEKATGKSWDAWVDTIDSFDGDNMTHKEIARKLFDDKRIISGWWCQMVTVGYEFAKGRRKLGETEGAGYEIGVSKTLPVSREKLWELLMSPEGVGIWLDAKEFKLEKGFHYETAANTSGEIKTITPGLKIRLTYQAKPEAKPSTLQVYLMANGEYNSKETNSAKTAIRFHHEKLKDREEREVMKKHWEEVISAIEKLI